MCVCDELLIFGVCLHLTHDSQIKAPAASHGCFHEDSYSMMRYPLLKKAVRIPGVPFDGVSGAIYGMEANARYEEGRITSSRHNDVMNSIH